MVALLLGNRPCAIHEIERLLEVGKVKRSRNVMFVDHVPVWQLMAERMQLRAFERRHAAAAGNTSFAG